MLSVDQALALIREHAQPLPARSVYLDLALGLPLAEDIVADIDLPPFDKALMDGYAVRSSDLAGSTEVAFRVVEEIAAGRVSARPLGKNEAARIMTGAPLPPGADAVVMLERARVDGTTVSLVGPVAPGRNRMTRGREMKVGDLLLTRGTRIDPVGLGLLASAGREKVPAIRGPLVAVIPTGDELVPASEVPGPGRIRNSNGPMLAALVQSWGGGQVWESPIVPDDPALLREALGRELGVAGGSDRSDQSRFSLTDVLIVSGGVSAGTKDLVPAALKELGVDPIFHKVNVKPGKPIWFGVGPRRPDKPGILVFGLPGNPVSGVVGFLLFVRPALEALAGRPWPTTLLASFPLRGAFDHRGDRPTYHPARLVEGRVVPLPWAGSADLRTVAQADGFAAFPAGDRTFADGEVVPFLPLR